MKVQRYRRKLFLTTVKTIQCNKIIPASGMKFSHINTREIHPAYLAVSLSGPARLPYKQPLERSGDVYKFGARQKVEVNHTFRRAPEI
jgi:hypothetical protein